MLADPKILPFAPNYHAETVISWVLLVCRPYSMAPAKQPIRCPARYCYRYPSKWTAL